MSNKICIECQKRVKLAYKIRGDLIKALERKKKKTIQVIKIIKSDPSETKSLSDGSVVHEELVEITEVDEDYNSEDENTEDYAEKDEQLMVVKDSEHVMYINEPDLLSEDVAEAEPTEGDEPLDAVSFLLEKKELFKNDEGLAKQNARRSHTCEVCFKKFMRKSNLVDHLRLHANIRLYTCEYCAKEFVQAGNYRSHLRVRSQLHFELIQIE